MGSASPIGGLTRKREILLVTIIAMLRVIAQKNLPGQLRLNF